MAKHWSWEYFTTDDKLFQNNKFYKNACCIACPLYHKEQLQQADIIGTAVSGLSSGRTDVDWDAQGSILPDFFSSFSVTDRLLPLLNFYCTQ
jgi:hypothetical protein